MQDLIEALQIFAKYTDTEYPTDCHKNELMICNIERPISTEDVKRLKELSFTYYDEGGGWISARFSNC